MGKKKHAPAFIPGFVSLGPSIWLQDPNYVSAGDSTHYIPPPPSQTQQTQHPHQGEPPLQSPPRTTRPTTIAFTASSNPLPLPSSSEAATQDTPDLILLTSWTGALPRHIAKYTLSYNQLYPGVPILAITTIISDLAFHSLKTKVRALAPAARYLVTSNRDRILLHAFSEGGTHKAVCLAGAYLLAQSPSAGMPSSLSSRPRSTPADPGSQGGNGQVKRLPVRAFVFDSTPGTPRYTSNVAAFKRSLPRSPAARALGVPIGASVLAVTWVLFVVFVGYENNIISETRRALNDDSLWADVRGAPRTYLFSEKDDLVHWRDVEKHGRETAEKLGVRSLLVRFRMSGHCGHARGNEGLYWGAVRRTWEARGTAVSHGEDNALTAGCSDGGHGASGAEHAEARHPVLTCVCCGERLEG